MQSKNFIFIPFYAIISIFIGISLGAIWTTNYDYIFNHLLGVIAGIFVYILFSRINFDFLFKFSYHLHLFSLFLMLLVLIPGIVVTVNGARRWLNLGFFNFQPSELSKLTLILYLTAAFYNKTKRIRKFNSKSPFWVSLITSLIILFVQNDFSTAIFVFSFYLVISFIAGENFKKLAAGTLSASFLTLIFVLTNKSYRFIRIRYWLSYIIGNGNPNWQLKYSLLSLSIGGKVGVGYGAGVYKDFLPAAHNDFIFSVVGEGLGFFALLIIILVYILFITKIIKIARKAAYDYELYFLFMGGYLISAQAAINMGVTIGLFPITGLTLPFISYGRTSLIIFMGLLGLMKSVEKNIIRRRF